VKKVLPAIFFCIAALWLVSVSLPAAFADDVSEQTNSEKATVVWSARSEIGLQIAQASAAVKTTTTDVKQERTNTGSSKSGLGGEGALDSEGAGEEAFEDEIMETMPDPLKPFNKVMFQVNDKLYFYVLKPVAQGYKFILSEPVRLSIRNVISNLTTPIRFVNCLLQGKLEGAGIEMSRFMVNTTTGVLGLFDVAKTYYLLDKQEEDFGQTLGHYGVKEGFYIVWPILGPSTLRDTFGRAGDYFSNPLLYVNPRRDWYGLEVNTDYPGAVTASDRINEMSLTLGTYEEFKESSIDPYTSMRSAYFEHRRNEIKK
jgi:phospholipid-binding lipoprotein MlaA